jgi:hypothetical protein
MRHVSQLQLIREKVAQAFSDAGLPPEELRETILIRNGCYCGRRFEVAEGHAIWFCEENQIKFYGPNGNVIRVIRELVPAENTLHHRDAA